MRFRVWPTDLDINLHVNNGRYFTIMDLGRTDLIIRMGILRTMLKHGWMPVLTSSTIRFRRELRLFEPFDLETSIIYWHGASFVMEHRLRFVKGRRAGAIAATALVKGGFYDRKERTFIAVDDLVREFNFGTSTSPPITPAVDALMRSEDTLRQHDTASSTDK